MWKRVGDLAVSLIGTIILTVLERPGVQAKLVEIASREIEEAITEALGG